MALLTQRAQHASVTGLSPPRVLVSVCLLVLNPALHMIDTLCHLCLELVTE